MEILNETILTNVVTEISVRLDNGESFTDRPNLDVSFFLNPLPERYTDRVQFMKERSAIVIDKDILQPDR
jgi:hypothetical protein